MIEPGDVHKRFIPVCHYKTVIITNILVKGMAGCEKWKIQWEGKYNRRFSSSGMWRCISWV